MESLASSSSTTKLEFTTEEVMSTTTTTTMAPTSLPPPTLNAKEKEALINHLRDVNHLRNTDSLVMLTPRQRLAIAHELDQQQPSPDATEATNSHNYEKRIANLEERIKTLERGALPSVKEVLEDISIPSYTGGAIPIHVWEFLEWCGNYLISHRIPNHLHGASIIKFTSEIARKTLEDFFFPHNFFPTKTKVEEVLLTNFGKTKLIIKIFGIQHEKIGQIPISQESNVSEVFEVVSQHEKLINRFEKLKLENEDMNEEYYSILMSILPKRELQQILQKNFEVQDMKQKSFEVHNCIRKLKEEVSYRKLEQEIYKSTFCLDPCTPSSSFVCEPKSKKKKNQKYSCTELSINACPLCTHLDKYAVVPYTRAHIINDNNNPITETCPHIGLKNIGSKNAILSRFKFCKQCLFVPLSNKHKEEECKFLEKFSNLKCKFKKCNIRASLCMEHIDLNRKAQKQKKKQFEDCGITYVI